MSENMDLQAIEENPPEIKEKKNLRVSKAEKWARAARNKISDPLRFIFDVESNWKYRTFSLEQKTEQANLISLSVYGDKKDRYVISESDYEVTADLIYGNKDLALALAIFKSLTFLGVNFDEGLSKAWEKAKAHEDPNKVLNVMKWAVRFVQDVEKLKGLDKPKKSNGSEKRRIEVKLPA